jgi:L-amino acid N-acyltransferase YncA
LAERRARVARTSLTARLESAGALGDDRPTMFSAHRATERDVEALSRLCAEATARGGALWGARGLRLDPAAWLSARVPLVAVGDASGLVGFAAAPSDGAPLGATKCAEALVYVTATRRKQGAARAAVLELVSAARVMGLWKLVSYALPEDVAARTLFERLDFREVGVLVKHVQIDRAWRDVALYERLVLAARRSMPSFHDA